MTLTKGAIVSGTLADAYRDSDATNLVLSEILGAYVDPTTGGGYTYDFEFGIYDNVPSSNVDLRFEGYYNGNPAHNIKLQQWNYTSSSWVDVTAASNDFPSSGTEQNYVFPLLDAADYISSGNIRIRIIHTSTGVNTHQLNIDKLYLTVGTASPSVSPSVSPSISPSASVSPSVSISVSPSESPSLSPSASASVSVSPSESPSLSPSSSESPSASPSESASVSVSVSPSISPSAPPAYTTGSTTWGHDTGVVETNVRDFLNNWTGTGEVQNSGDAERLALNTGEYMESEIVDTGTVTVEFLYNNYQAGDTVTFQYRHGADATACAAASYQNYTAPFESLGFVQIKVSA